MISDSSNAYCTYVNYNAINVIKIIILPVWFTDHLKALQ